MIDPSPSTQRENIVCVSTASLCHKASNGSHVFFVRVGGTVCKCFHLSHTHRTDSIRLHTMAPQNDRTHSTIYSLSLGTITRYTLWDVLQDSSSHRLFCFPLLLPLPPHSSHVLNYSRLITYLYVVLQGKQTLITERNLFLTHLVVGVLVCFVIFIWVTLSLLCCQCFAMSPTWPVTGHTMVAWLHHAWSSMIHSGKYSLWGCIQRDSGRDSLKDLKSDLPDYITTCWMSHGKHVN